MNQYPQISPLLIMNDGSNEFSIDYLSTISLGHEDKF